MNEYTSNGISITTQCPDCIYLDDYDYRCKPCIEQEEAKLSDFAHNIVDEANDIYEHPWSRIQDNPSSSDWVTSQTITGKAGKIVKMIENWDDNCHLIELSVKFLDNEEEHTIRYEFLPPIAQLIDGGELDNLYELDDWAQAKREILCPWCHIFTPRIYNDCQNTTCSLPLENNIR